MLYLKIKSDNISQYKNQKESVLLKLLSFFIPKANPDFENKIHLVSFWLLEFENEKSFPNREIGFNSSNKVILKMPYKKNYGYWTDNDLTFNDFKERFDWEIIDKKSFEENWLLLN